MRIRLLQFVLILGLCITALYAQKEPAGQQSQLLGFDRDASGRERALEKQFDSFIKSDNLRDWMKRLSARPHHLGSAYDKENAEFIASLFRSWGYDTAIERFDVLFPTPKKRVLEMTAPQKFIAKLEEPALQEDATSAQKSEQLPV